MAHPPWRPPTTPPRLRMMLILGSTAGITIAAMGTAIAATSIHALPKRTSTSTVSPLRTATAPGTPRFFNYASPPGTADDAGEPSLGINWLSERTFSNSAGPIPNGGTSNYFGGFLPYMVKVVFNDCQSPALATWEQKPVILPATPRVFGDPILFTDHTTGRTFVSQLEGLTPLGSTTEFTDNDGDTFSPSEGSGLPSCIDHQTFGGGPFHAPLTPTSLYPHAIYYASQCVTHATCSISLDGGVTFGPGVPMFTIADCDGLHGHIKVAPDGTVYVPDKGCATASVPLLNGGQAAAIVSEDNGVTWSIRPIPDGSSPGEWDPSIGIATDGTAYLGYQAIDGHAHIAVTHDRGVHWSTSYDVGAQLGIENIAFPAVVAGDPNRAAFAFYGTTTSDAEGGSHNGGPDGDDPNSFTGIWYLYIATTFDGGQTWTTQNVTPGDPIQRGPICSGGDCRNMLDFFDASIDKEGRVLVGWDDGCIGGCVSGPPNSFTAKATITRQSGGMRMFSAYDPVEPRLAEAPGPTGSLVNSTVHLSWQAPDDGGAAITGYKVYRRIGSGVSFTLLATVTQTNYTDTVDPTRQNFYRVTAVNSQGEGPYCQDVLPAAGAGPTACVVPGIQAVNDVNPNGSDNDSGQNTPPDPSVNIRDLSIAEPYVAPGVNQLVFTLQMTPSTGTVPPSSQWYIIWNRKTVAADGSDRRFVAMKTDLSGAESFAYGDFGPPIPLDGSVPPSNANTPTPLGAADFGSYDPASGTITIKLATSKADDTPLVAGNDLAGLNVRTYFVRPDAGQKSQNNASDITVDGSYALVGNASCFCAVDRPPVAGLTASPTSGKAPLTVGFNGSTSSDPDAGDGVGSYTFNFGDGSAPVTQAGATISHTYKSASGSSGYFATLTVTDAKCGRPSLNTASVNIQVTGKKAPHRATATPEAAFQLTSIRNPVHRELDFELALDQDGPVRVRVFSSAGRRVADLLDAWMPAGTHALRWSGRDASGSPAAAGVYFVQAKAGARVTTTRTVLLP